MPYGRAMPSVSGETFALPPSNACHALTCTAGITAFMRVGAGERRELRAAARSRTSSAPRSCMIWSAQIFSTVAITSGGTLFGMKMPK